jgi:eukaryotic-like serine/threonine-protein kinase
VSLTTVDGRYQIIARIAAGGMGEVFHAHDSVLAREVAIKVLHPGLASERAFIDRFRREARAAANLSHPNIVQVHDWGERDGTSFMVMEYVRGPNLRELHMARGRLMPAQVAEVVLQILAALDHAHRRGIVHRDVKPENALLTPEGVVKVADFGLAHALAEARITQAPGTVTGTVQYLAPEQIRGEPADPRTDLYALGVVTYELLTGRPPFNADTAMAVAYKHLSEQVAAPSDWAPDVPEKLDRIVLAATAKDPDDRPRSAADMRADLVAVVGSLPSAPRLSELAAATPARDDGVIVDLSRATTVTIPQVASPRRGQHRARRRRRWPWVVLSVLLVLALAAGGWAAWTYVIPHSAAVPQVVGLGAKEARSRLDAAGFAVKTGAPIPSIKIAEGDVAKQQPPPGTHLKKGSVVTFQLSTGPPMRTVPSVKGLPVATAKNELSQHGFVPVIVKQWSEAVPVGRIVTQSPDGTAHARYGSKVHLVESKGPEPVLVPQVTGRPSTEATAILQAAGFTVQQVNRFSDTVSRGVVMRQHPSSGTAPRGSAITIVVSKGPKAFPMPNVAGHTRAAAVQELKDLGLTVNVVVIPSSSGNTVVGQNPNPGTTVHPGDSVTIYLA